MKTILITLLFFLIPLISYPCSCVGEVSIIDEYERVNAVIFGEIVSSEIVAITEKGEMPIPTSDSTFDLTEFYTLKIARYELKVEKTYKGKVKTDTIEIYTGLGGGDCGYNFNIGEKYLVYGYIKSYLNITNKKYSYPKGNKIFWTNICMRTTYEYENEIKELERYLNKKDD